MKHSPEPSLSPANAWPCPLCDHSSQRQFQQHGFWIRDCQGCNHRFTEIDASLEHVRSIYSDSYFHGGGAGYPDYLAEASLLRRHGQRYAQLLSHYLSPGTLLDVGAAAGFILQGFLDSGWQGRGIEPNPSMVQYAQQTLRLPVEVGTLEQLQPSGTPEAVDLMVMIQVIAHFFDIRRAFAAASYHTKPGGFWLIETWNWHSWTARLLGKNWHEYSPPSVLHWFSPQSLAQFATRYGFKEVGQGRPPKLIGAAHAKSLLAYKLQLLPGGKCLSHLLSPIPDQWTIPYPAEDLFWILLQKQ
ncbi:MAG TPA: class I SAM-dependent methyltransferase [Stenomitos sp.]